MSVRTAQAQWAGRIQSGKGTLKLGSGMWEAPFSPGSRMGNDPGTNPEELIGAAHASCYTLALTAYLSLAGHAPESVQTTASVELEQTPDGGFRIPRIALRTEARVLGIDNAAFQEVAQTAKVNCPVSKALAGVDIQLDARLVG